MNRFKSNRTVGEFYFFGSAFLLITVILIVGFQSASSQQEQLQSDSDNDSQQDTFQSFITSGGAIVTFVIGLSAIGALIIGIFKKVQGNMTREAKSIIEGYEKQAKAYFESEKREREKARQEQKEALQQTAQNLSLQVSGVNNNVDTKYNTTTEKINEIKETVNEIKKDVSKSNNDNIKNATVLVEHERRISSLETSRFQSSQGTGAMRGI